MWSQQLTELLEPVVVALGYELVCLELGGSGRSSTLRLFIDAPTGVGLDDCARVSREVAAVLDVEDPIPHAYQLEVSSPGLDRPLVKPEHYRRFRGERVRVQMAIPIEGRRRFEGILNGLSGGTVELRTAEGLVQLPLREIERARLLPNLNAERKAR
jgi:ribosome maturation factor RimP